MSKVALISGASRGIGRAIAERLLDAGYQLSLGVRHSEVLENTALIESKAVHHFAYQATDRESPKQWVAEAKARFGRIDVLINCAGVLLSHRLEDEDEEALDQMWEINLKAPLRLTRAAFPALKESGEGRVINLVSMSGKRVKSLATGYGISKFAQMALSQATRNTGWEHGIRTTAICPSWVNTEMAAAASSLAAEEMSQPEDIAELVHTVLQLPNSAHVNEIAVNCALETC